MQALGEERLFCTYEENWGCACTNLISLKKALQFAEFFYGALLNCYSVLVINLINAIILQDDKILNISI